MEKTKYDSINTSKVYNNTDQNLIRITEDKLYNILKDHCDDLKKKNNWTTPFSISLTILLSLITSQFRDALFIEAPVWKAIFIVALAISTGLLVRTVYYGKKIDVSLDSLMNQIKNKK